MHEHPASVAVWLSDENSKHTFGDGKTEERHTKAGQTFWGPAAKHMAENLSDKRIELILVELKAKPARISSRDLEMTK